MLMKTPTSLVYLSAVELGITERERAGPIEVRDDLASGRVKHTFVTARDYSFSDNRETKASFFNMAFWHAKPACGTCYCFGGFMEARNAFKDGRSHVLQALFTPEPESLWPLLTVEQAVRAADHFLAGAGAACWPMALQDIPVA